jgi:hypothetical protein
MLFLENLAEEREQSLRPSFAALAACLALPLILYAASESRIFALLFLITDGYAFWIIRRWNSRPGQVAKTSIALINFGENQD